MTSIEATDLNNARLAPASANTSEIKSNDYYPSSAVGDAHGNSFDDKDIKNIQRAELISIKVRCGQKVDALQCVYKYNGAVFEAPNHGGTGGRLETFTLWPGERIVGFKGRSGWQVDGIQFITSTGRQSPYYGGSGGGWFEGPSYNINPFDTKGGLQWISGTQDGIVTSFKAWWSKYGPE